MSTGEIGNSCDLSLSEVERLNLAVNDVKNNGLSYGKAAQIYQIGKKRIIRAKKSVDLGKPIGRNGRPPLMSPSMISALGEKIAVSAASGNAMNHMQVRNEATSLIVHSNNSKTEYVMPQRTYYDYKQKLKDQCRVKFGTAISTSDARMKANNVRTLTGFFDKLDAIYKLHPLLNLEPGRIAVVDESPLHQQSEKLKLNEQVAFCPEDMDGRSPRRTVVGDGSSHVSVITVACADGQILPQNGYLITGKYPQMGLIAKPYPPRVDTAHLKGLFVYATPCGSSTMESWNTYLCMHVVPLLKKRFPEGPLLLLFDNPACHLLYEDTQKSFSDNNVIFLTFPANTSTFLDPLDIHVFGMLKKEIYNLITITSRLYSSPGMKYLIGHTLKLRKPRVSENNLTEIERAAGFENRLTPRTLMLMSEAIFKLYIEGDISLVQGGFSRAGIYPFNPGIVLRHCMDFVPSTITPLSNPSSSIEPSVLDELDKTYEILGDNLKSPTTKKRDALKALGHAETPRRLLKLHLDQMTDSVLTSAATPKVKPRTSKRQLTFQSSPQMVTLGALDENLKRKGESKAPPRKKQCTNVSETENEQLDGNIELLPYASI